MGSECCAKDKDLKTDPQEESLFSDVSDRQSIPQKLKAPDSESVFISKVQALKSNNSKVNVVSYYTLDYH
jgi:hypothetical protein